MIERIFVFDRKMHMCSYMEEETSIYRALYGGKRFLKSESMKLLNEAFQDFASEIFLLDQEYRAMQSVHSSLARRQHFCLEYQKRVDMLNALGTQLGLVLFLVFQTITYYSSLKK